MKTQIGVRAREDADRIGLRTWLVEEFGPRSGALAMFVADIPDPFGNPAPPVFDALIEAETAQAQVIADDSDLGSRAALRGRVAVIVGGGSGIGAAVTLALAEAGVDVAFCDIDEAESSATQQAAEALGVQALAQHADVTVVDELDAFYASVTDRRFDAAKRMIFR